eukprot:CAMPEP_0113258646 /NCGR_PEP_ID=MMETSP0008_2-20120614/15935_1 /TAXON_ID=97485 /ORGANISM="Prymnesium parvum" /LENGTH=120 /DNA_ID=CAMNT_0000107123 /DNA_START=912 /DNA_END=1274 /DNA_ORIENTATION=- /assembly_acc=CAM_ASM_000153
MADEAHSECHLEPLNGPGAQLGGHPGIAYQCMQMARAKLVFKRSHKTRHTFQVGEVQLDGVEGAGTRRGSGGSGGCLLDGAARHHNSSALVCKQFGSLQPDPCIAPCHDDDLASQALLVD